MCELDKMTVVEEQAVGINSGDFDAMESTLKIELSSVLFTERNWIPRGSYWRKNDKVFRKVTDLLWCVMKLSDLYLLFPCR